MRADRQGSLDCSCPVAQEGSGIEREIGTKGKSGNEGKRKKGAVREESLV